MQFFERSSEKYARIQSFCGGEKNSPLLGENMSNIKLWSDAAPCNINRVLPFESILCLSDFLIGKEAIIIQQC